MAGETDTPPPPPRSLSRFGLRQPQPPPGTVRIGPAQVPPPTPWQLWGQGLLEAVVDPVRGALWGATGPEDTLAAKSAETILAGLPLVQGLSALVKGRGFYSRVDEALKLLPKKGAHPNKIASILKSNASAEELAYRGVPEFLASKGNATVTPAELAAHLAAHPAPVPNVKTLGGREMWSPELKSALLGLQPGTQMGWIEAAEKLERIAQRWQHNGDPAQANRYFTLSEEARSISEGVNPATGSTRGMPKYAQYQLPGGESYRETLVTLPGTESPKVAALRAEIEALTELPAKVTTYKGEDRTAAFDRLSKEFFAAGGTHERPQGFTSGHFDEPNILVHTRANERALPTGERGRFVEEVQSDWHQKGKAQGYKGADLEAVRQDLARRNSDLQAQLRALGEGDTAQHHAVREQLGALTDEWNAFHDQVQYGVPDAPFKATWPDLGLKQQVLETAADPHAQWIGFTSGQTQAARYDLSKQLSEIRYDPDTHFFEAFDLGGDSVIRREHVKPTDLPDLIGKEPAERLLQQEVLFDSADEANYHILSGQNLQVGGEGMRHFYDQVLPKRLEKIVKPFGGTVERGAVSRGGAHLDLTHQGPGVPPVVPDAPEPAWFARLTPEMKARILKEGLPLLSLTAFLAQMGQPPKSKEAAR